MAALHRGSALHEVVESFCVDELIMYVHRGQFDILKILVYGSYHVIYIPRPQIQFFDLNDSVRKRLAALIKLHECSLKRRAFPFENADLHTRIAVILFVYIRSNSLQNVLV